MGIDANEEELKDKLVDWDRVDGEETALGRWRQSDERRISSHCQALRHLFKSRGIYLIGTFKIRFLT